MNAQDYLKSNYLNGSELTTPQIVTIRDAEVKELGDEKEEKIILEFYELPKSLPLNKTRLRAMCDAFGFETQAWLNQKVMVYGQRLNSGKFSGQWTISLVKAPAESAQVTTEQI